MNHKFFTLCALAFAGVANAHDELGIQPATVTAGTSTSIDVYANATDGVLRGVVLDLELPTEDWKVSIDATSVTSGWTVTTSSDGSIVAYSQNYTSQTGKLFSLSLSVPEGTADGCYCINTKTSSMLGFSGTSGETSESVLVSYVTVGSGTSLTTDAGTLLSFAQEALNSDATITTLDMSATTAINEPEEGFAFVDGRQFTAPEAGLTVSKATYSRTVSDESKYSSVKLPFTTSDGTYYVYNSTSSVDGNIVFSSQTGLEANTPAIAIGSISAEGTDVTLTDQLNSTATSGYYLSNNNLYEITSNVNIAPYRTVYTFGDQTTVRSLTLSDGMTDGISINVADASSDDSLIYDLSGRRASKTARGIRIVNGKKVVTNY